ncbi:MAG: phosphate-starvation-inducible PsiE family protein [Chlamydiales bacterium]|nr:phosphate-starvation-inducible PsiE family protein [Chlamydiales bacterium]
MLAVKVLAFIVAIIVWLSLVDVVVHTYRQYEHALFDVESLIVSLGNVLLVLIAIEVFLNIVFYLIKDAINVSLVLATALTAVARKVIILDYKSIEPLYVFAIAAVIVALGVAYFLTKKSKPIA